MRVAGGIGWYENPAVTAPTRSELWPDLPSTAAFCAVAAGGRRRNPAISGGGVISFRFGIVACRAPVCPVGEGGFCPSDVASPAMPRRVPQMPTLSRVAGNLVLRVQSNCFVKPVSCCTGPADCWSIENRLCCCKRHSGRQRNPASRHTVRADFVDTAGGLARRQRPACSSRSLVV